MDLTLSQSERVLILMVRLLQLVPGALPASGGTPANPFHTILTEIRTMSDQVANLSQKITTLQQDVTQNSDVTQSAVTLINGFAQRLADAIAAAQAQGVQPAQLQSLTDLHQTLSSNSQALAQAVAANTQAAPAEQPTEQPASLVEDQPATPLTPDANQTA